MNDKWYDMVNNDHDLLRSIFSRMPEETLPSGFQTEMMQRIKKEAARIAKRNERFRVLALIAASLFTIGLAVAALIYMGIPPITTEFPGISIPPNYIYFGMLVLFLLCSDHLLRRLYYKRRN